MSSARWQVHRTTQLRMVNHGIEYIAYDADNLASYTYDEIYGVGATIESPYGDPERALICEQTPPVVRVRERAAPERIGRMQHLIGLLNEMDQCILMHWHLRTEGQGITEEELAAQIGISQPSANARRKRAMEWLRFGVEMHEQLEDFDADELPVGHQLIWYHIIELHQSQTQTAVEINLPQTTVYPRWHAIVSQSRGTRWHEPFSKIAKNFTKWTVPRHYYSPHTGKLKRQQHDRKKKERKTGVAKRKTDPELRAFWLDYEMELAFQRAEFGLPNKVELRTQSDGRGIDLSRQSVLTEIRKLFHKFGNARCLRCGVDPEDACAEVLKDLEVRNQGTCRFDPDVAAWSTYVVMRIHQTCSRMIDKHQRRRRVESEIALDAKAFPEGELTVGELVIDASYTPEEHDRALRRVLTSIEKHAGEDGVEYARLRLRGEPLAGVMKPARRQRVREHMDAIRADCT